MASCYGFLFHGILSAPQARRYLAAESLICNLFLRKTGENLALVFPCVVLSHAKCGQTDEKFPDCFGLSIKFERNGMQIRRVLFSEFFHADLNRKCHVGLLFSGEGKCTKF